MSPANLKPKLFINELYKKFKKEPKEYSKNEGNFILIYYEDNESLEVGKHEAQLGTLEIIKSRSICSLEIEAGDFYSEGKFMGRNTSYYKSGTPYQAKWEGNLKEILLLGIRESFLKTILKQEFGIDKIDISQHILSNRSNENLICQLTESLKTSIISNPNNTKLHDKILESITIALIEELTRGRMEPKNSKKELAENIKRYIENNCLNEDFRDRSNKELENVFGRKLVTINNLLRKYYEETVNTIIKDRIAQHIIKQLTRGVEVKILAEEFNRGGDISNFNKAFRKRTKTEVTVKQARDYLLFLRSLDEDGVLKKKSNISTEEVKKQFGFKNTEDTDKIATLAFGVNLEEYINEIKTKALLGQP